MVPELRDNRATLIVLANGDTYLAEKAWTTGDWLHVINARPKLSNGRLHGEPADYEFAVTEVKRVRHGRPQ